ncbi:MAG: adenylosuccinate synthase [Dehalococcoidales bacterium]|nr:adenylosuccinate synthase [Dehalococcoidales bacterium]
MPAIAIIGAQWGDEGKGKIVDRLSQKADVVVRYSGGDNAGHTVVNKRGEFKLHLTPSGIFTPGTTSILGNGVVINPSVLIKEIEGLNSRGIDTSRLYISDRAHLIMPYHVLFDGLEEEAKGDAAIGTTLKGIGPVYCDKVGRLGIRAGDILDKAAFKKQLAGVLKYKNALLTGVFGKPPLSLEDIYQEYCGYADRLGKYICDIIPILEEAIKNNKVILMEGAQGSMLDPDFGTYPFVTSSSPLSGNACLGSGINPSQLTAVIGIFKAYCSRVGAGPFPTELKDATGDLIRETGHEYGTTTGRPRRCGWFDAVVSRFSTKINGFTGAAITRLDILDTFPKLNICTAYKLDGKVIDYVPGNTAAMFRCEPVYEEIDGWQCNVSDIRKYEDLPLAARRYLSRIEELIGCPIKLISVGKHADQTIEVGKLH